MSLILVMTLREDDFRRYVRVQGSIVGADGYLNVYRRLHNRSQIMGLRGANITLHVLPGARWMPDWKYTITWARAYCLRVVFIGWLENIYQRMPVVQRGGLL